MQRIHLRYGLIFFSLLLPYCLIAENSLAPLSKGETSNIQHHTDQELGQKDQEEAEQKYQEDSIDKNKEKDVSVSHKLLELFIAQNITQKNLTTLTTEHNTAINAYTGAFKPYSSNKNSEQAALKAIYTIAVEEKKNTEISLAIAKLMYDVNEKRNRRFYQNVSNRDLIIVGSTFLVTAATALLIHKAVPPGIVNNFFGSGINVQG